MPDPNAAAYQAWLATPAGQAAINTDAGQAPTGGASIAATVAPDVAVAAPAPAPAAPAAAPAIDYTQLAQALVAAGAVPAAPAAAPAPAEKAPVAVNQFIKGQLIEHTWDDPYDGPSTRAGIVLEVLPDEGAGARSVVGWFVDVSGPIGDQYLTAV